MKAWQFFLAILLIVPVIRAGCTMDMNETFETRDIGDYNTSQTTWSIASASCKAGSKCLQFTNSLADGHAFSSNSTFIRASGTNMVIKGYIQDYTGAGDGGYPGIMFNFQNTTNYQLATTYATNEPVFRFNNITYVAGVRSIVSVNSSAGSYNAVFVYCEWNITTDNFMSQTCWANSSKGTPIADAYKYMGPQWTNGYVGYGCLRNCRWDNIETWTCTEAVVAPVITLINFTSDSPPEWVCTWPNNCVNTTDKTPTFELATDINAKCRVSTTDTDYPNMTINCTPSDHYNTTHSCTHTTVLGQGSNNLYFSCQGSDGVNMSALAANSSKAKISINNTAPTVTLNSPANGTNFTNGEPVTLNWTATDDDNATFTCTVYRNTTALGANSTTNNTVTSFRTSLPLGTSNWSVNCTDTATTPLTGRSGAFNITMLDTTAPTITLNHPANGTAYEGVRNLTFNFTATDSFSATFPCNFQLDGNVNGTNSSVANNTLTGFALNNIDYGNHTWLVNCTDNSGNHRVSTTYNFSNVILVNASFALQTGGFFFNPNFTNPLTTYAFIRNGSSVITGVSNITSPNNSAQNQTDVKPILNISAVGLTAPEINISMNLTNVSGGPAYLVCANSSNMSKTQEINNTRTIRIGTITSGTTMGIWCWLNYLRATGQYNFTVNITENSD